MKLLKCDAVLDVSGGDSFADIYGEGRFKNHATNKLLFRDLGIPLVLLPQTYGPFSRPRSVDLARQIIDYSCLVATRDIHGLEELDRLLGGRMHPRAVCVPDMGFLLDPLPVPLDREPIIGNRGNEPLIGLNVSGLLNMSDGRFDIKDSYPRLVVAIAEWAIERRGARVLLVPHVVSGRSGEGTPSPTGVGDSSDTVACTALAEKLRGRYGDRVASFNECYGPGQTKFLIGHCDFFIGARMHACIGAVSQTTPTVTLAYSNKALGVMSHVEMQETVLDLRQLTVGECIERIDRLYERRLELRARLRQIVPVVQERVCHFFTKSLPEALRWGHGKVPVGVGCGREIS